MDSTLNSRAGHVTQSWQPGHCILPPATAKGLGMGTRPRPIQRKFNPGFGLGLCGCRSGVASSCLATPRKEAKNEASTEGKRDGETRWRHFPAMPCLILCSVCEPINSLFKSFGDGAPVP